MAAKECDCIKRDVCVFYSDGDYPQVCDKCGHYIMEKGFTSTNTARDAICPHWEIYNRGGSGEFGVCNCGGKIGSGQTAPVA